MKKIISTFVLIVMLFSLTAVFAGCMGSSTQLPKEIGNESIIENGAVTWYTKNVTVGDKNTYVLYIVGNEENPVSMFAEKVEEKETEKSTETTETTDATDATDATESKAEESKATEAAAEAAAVAAEAEAENATTDETKADETKADETKADETKKETVKVPTKASEMPWYVKGIYNQVTHIEIRGVTDIPDYAFANMISLQTVDFGKSVTSIGKCSFAFCYSLKNTIISGETKDNFVMPETIKTIGESAFEGCSKLESVTLPDSIEQVGAKAFAFNYSLTKIIVPEKFELPENTYPVVNSDKKLVTNTNVKVENPAPPVEEPDESETESGTTSDETSTETKAEDKKEDKEINWTTTIIAIVIFVVVIAGVIVGAILLKRSNNKQTKDARTVRKNDNDKEQNNKNSNTNSNKNKGKKK